MGHKRNSHPTGWRVFLRRFNAPTRDHETIPYGLQQAKTTTQPRGFFVPQQSRLNLV